MELSKRKFTNHETNRRDYWKANDFFPKSKSSAVIPNTGKPPKLASLKIFKEVKTGS